MGKIPAKAKKTEGNGWVERFGPLKDLLLDNSVTEIMVNGPYKVFIEQNGLLKKTPHQFKDQDSLYQVIDDIARYVGRSVSKKSPCLDARLPDGSRVNLVVPPVAVDGASITIRKFSPFSMNHEQLIRSGMFDERMAYFLSCCVSARLNVLICGGTGSGKTTLLNVLSSFIPSHERLVTIEDAAELKIKNDNLVRLETRPTIDKGESPVTIRSLVINALRMRPDRIIVGECRGGEALDMLIAMNTGHEGSMTTLHSNSAREALRRLEGMVLMAGTEFPLRVVREHISSAIDVVVNVQRQPDGKRRVSKIIEVGNMESEVILTQEIFSYSEEEGFHSSGFVPRFVSKFSGQGIDFPKDFFSDAYTVRQIKRR